MRRLLVDFSDDEHAFLMAMRLAIRKVTGKKLNGASPVIRAVINDYRQIFERHGSPNIVKAIQTTTKCRFL